MNRYELSFVKTILVAALLAIIPVIFFGCSSNGTTSSNPPAQKSEVAIADNIKAIDGFVWVKYNGGKWYVIPVDKIFQVYENGSNTCIYYGPGSYIIYVDLNIHDVMGVISAAKEQNKENKETNNVRIIR